jgi:electron transfer flavoprotein beta subunit
MKAKKKPMEVTTAEELGVSVVSNVKTLSVAPPAERSAGIMVESVEQLVDKLKNEAKVI